MTTHETIAKLTALGLLALAVHAAILHDLSTLARLTNQAEGKPAGSYVKIRPLCDLSHSLCNL